MTKLKVCLRELLLLLDDMLVSSNSTYFSYVISYCRAIDLTSRSLADSGMFYVVCVILSMCAGLCQEKRLGR